MKRIALVLLRAYKWLISPLLGPACRYVPSCSEYAMEAVARFGIVRGGLKAAWRLARCHPLAKGGFDPVVSCQLAVASCRPEQTLDGRRTSFSDGNPALCTGAPVLATDNRQLTTDN
ncbi:MAG: membrane protein insertion efficiency factor YidD [Terriglobales bacterium]